MVFFDAGWVKYTDDRMFKKITLVKYLYANPFEKS